MSSLPQTAFGTATWQSRDLLVSLILLPRNVLLGLLLLYRKIISPMYGDVCAYYPSCSAYGFISVQQYGALLGTFRAVYRILRCNPWSRGGVDDVPSSRFFVYALTTRGFVVPARKE